MKKALLFFFVLLLNSIILSAQQDPVDSLSKLLKKEKIDSNRIKHMLELADFVKFEDPTTAYSYIQQSLQLSQKTKYYKHTHKIYRILGIIYATTGKPDSSKYSFDQSLEYAQKYGNDQDVGNAYNNIGINYYYSGNFLKANECYLKALKAMEIAKNYTGIANAQANLGIVNLDLRKYDEAEKCYLEAEKNYQKAGDKLGLAQTQNDLGRFYFDKNKDYKKAMQYFSSSRKALLDMKIYPSVVANYLFSAEACIAMNDFKKAKQFSDSSFYYTTFSQDSMRIAQNYTIQAKIFMNDKDFVKAKDAVNKAIQISQSIKVTSVEMEADHLLAELLFKTGNSGEAYLRQRDYIKLKDSIFNSENAQQMQTLQTIYQTEKKENENKLLQTENELKNMEISDFKTSRNYMIGIIGLAALIILGGVYAYRKIRKNNKMLAFQKIAIEQKNSLLEHKNEEIQEKNKEITDSINYASRIQAALLPGTEDFQKLFSNSFVLFQPKDIVSGDFYWETSTDEYIFYATADCTGHGVPGGFMSMLGMALLNEIIGEKKIYEPCDIFDMMRIKLISTLKQKGVSGENKDGMDMVLCRVKKDSNELVFAAANNPLWLFREGAIIEYKADKQPVGIYSGGELNQFNQQTILLQKNDIVYTFTDGFADQFGGPKGKKYKYKQLEEILLSLAQHPMEEQKQQLKQSFDSWKGTLEQVDDVCIIGVRV